MSFYLTASDLNTKMYLNIMHNSEKKVGNYIMSFLLACLISPGGAILGALVCLAIGAPLTVTIFTIFAIPIISIVLFKIITSSQESPNKLKIN